MQEVNRLPIQEGTVPVVPDAPSPAGLDRLGVPGMPDVTRLADRPDLSAASLGDRTGSDHPDITSPSSRGRERVAAAVPRPAEAAEPPKPDAGGGGDVPRVPEAKDVPTPEEDPEFRGACFGADVLEKVIGVGDIPPRHVDDQGREVYDECRQIATEARRAIKAMRDNAKVVAEAVGMKISEEDFEAWKPDVAGLAKLRKDLAPSRIRMRMVQGADAYIEDQASEATAEGIQLRPHQQDVVKGYRDFLRFAEPTTPQGGKSGLIVQPTGTGKTRELVETVAMIRHMEDPGERSRVLVLSPTLKIQDQNIGANGKQGFGKFMPDEPVGRYDEGTPPAQRQSVLEMDTVGMCLPSAVQLINEGRMPHFDKIVVDEGHTVVGTKTADALMRYAADKIMIGLTATPDYDQIRTARNVFKHNIAEMEIPEAARGGLTAPIRGFLVQTDPIIEGRLPDDPIERRAALREAQMEGRVRAAVEIIKKELERGYAELKPYCDKKGVVNRGIGVVVRCRPGDNVNEAFEFAKRLRGMLVKGPDGPLDMREIMPAFVGGDAKRQAKGVREEVLDAYSAQRINVVANVKYLEMGWDEAFDKVWIDLADGSEVSVKQGMGRAVRIMCDENGDPILGPDGKPIEAHVYSFVNPERGDRQYTVLNALQTKSGELLQSSGEREAPIPKPRAFGPDNERTTREPRAEVNVRDVVATTVGTVAVGEEIEVPDVEVASPSPEPAVNPLAPSGWPNQSGLDEFVEVFGSDEQMPLSEAARVLGVSAPTFKGMMGKRYGDPNRTPTLGDVRDILSGNPLLAAPPQPDAGFTEIPLRDISVRRFARQQGMALQRFTSHDGIVRFFVSNANLYRLLELMQEQERRQ